MVVGVWVGIDSTFVFVGYLSGIFVVPAAPAPADQSSLMLDVMPSRSVFGFFGVQGLIVPAVMG